MKVIVDETRCEAHGQCMLATAEVFDLPDDADGVTVLDPEPPEALRDKVEHAVMVCPANAIRIEG